MADFIILKPHSTLEIEAAIWAAVTDNPRDWTEFEKSYIEAHRGVAESLHDWHQCNTSKWTTPNIKFAKRLYRLIQLSLDVATCTTVQADQYLG
jgi:hypothetical protein